MPCIPVNRLDSFFDQHDWSIEYRKAVTKFGMPSEVLIASPKNPAQQRVGANARWGVNSSETVSGTGIAAGMI
jgi:hypothetical protein